MKASACGKAILFGEHAVVHGRPAIAVPVSGLRVYAEISDGKGIIYNHPIDKVMTLGQREEPLVKAAWMALDRMGTEDTSFDIHLSGDIPISSGLGSGPAVVVAIIRAIGMRFHHDFGASELAVMSFETEKIFHGNPSGIDNTVVSYEQPVYFIKGKPITLLQVGKPFTIVIGDTGVPKASTKELVEGVAARMRKEPVKYNALMDEMAEIANKAKRIIESGDPSELGVLMDRNHALLRELGVSHPMLEKLVKAAKDGGALGAKLVGAGGGGNMIALAEHPEKVRKALLKAGAKQAFVTVVE
jgi:mevalonate kinase